MPALTPHYFQIFIYYAGTPNITSQCAAILEPVICVRTIIYRLHQLNLVMNAFVIIIDEKEPTVCCTLLPHFLCLAIFALPSMPVGHIAISYILNHLRKKHYDLIMNQLISVYLSWRLSRSFTQ